MRDLTELGFSMKSDVSPLSVSVDGTSRYLPDDYIALLGHAPPDDLELAFKFVEASTHEEWEGQVVEFIRHDTTTVQDALISPPTEPTRKMLPIAADAGGNYIYLDVSSEDMPVIDVGYETGVMSVIAESFGGFLDKLYLTDE